MVAAGAWSGLHGGVYIGAGKQKYIYMFFRAAKVYYDEVNNGI